MLEKPDAIRPHIHASLDLTFATRLRIIGTRVEDQDVMGRGVSSALFVRLVGRRAQFLC